MKFKKVLNESGIQPSQKFSISMLLETKRQGNLNDFKKYEVTYKWKNPVIPANTHHEFIAERLLKLKFKSKLVELNNLKDEIIDDFKSVGLGKYIASPEDSSWSELTSQSKAISKQYPKKTRAFDTRNGHDMVIHFRLDIADDGTKKFVARNDTGNAVNVLATKEIEPLAGKA